MYQKPSRIMFPNMPKITFFVRSNNDKNNTFALYCRVYVNERASEFSTKENVSPNEWNQEKQIYETSTKEKSEYINLLCDRIKYKIKTIALTLENEQSLLCPKKLIELFRSPNKPKNVIIYDVIQSFIDWEISEEELDSKTIAIHERYLKHLKEFVNRSDYYVTDFTEVEAEKFKDWFKLERDTKNKTTASRHISYYRNALTWGVKKGLIKAHNLLYYKGERDKAKKPISITEAELLELIKFQFKSDMLSNIKDLFLFQIATGVSYGDIWNVFEIQETQAGKIIVGNRNKGEGNAFFVPYDEMAEALLIKHNYKLPVYCNGAYNRLLKEIAALVGIDKKLKTHTGRKTFATLKISHGWSLYSVSLMLGHTTTKTTEAHYVERNSGALVSEMLIRNQQQTQSRI